MDLSILIPGRNEEWLPETLQDLLKNIRGNTEIIVVLDGEVFPKELPTHERITYIHHPESRGQRAATNDAAHVARGTYLMKTDAHTAWDEGFDVKMVQGMKDLGDDTTLIPVMRNLHVFDWVCPDGHRRYQGVSGVCIECGKPTEKEVVWNPKSAPQSTAYLFDTTLHFQYWNEFKRTEKGKQRPYSETMSIQGSCFMLHRDKYFELDISEEAFGSWGQQGVEVACKTWLSGGKVMVNHNTWYAHLFRTAGGDFGFPYKQENSQVQHARDYSRRLFQENNWPKAVHSFQWLLDRFAPVPYWDVTKEIIYYTDCQAPEKVASAVRNQLTKSGLPIVSVSLNEPVDLGKNVVVKGERGYLTMFKQILKGLEASKADVVFLCEHDVLYPPEYFQFVPPKKDRIYYNKNVWHYRASDGFAVSYDAKRVSQICAYRDVLVEHYRKRVKVVEERGFSRAMGFEPGTHNRPERVDDLKSEYFESPIPAVDIKHGKNLTAARWNPSEFRDQRNCQNWREQYNVREWDGLNVLQ
jgi:glycosyltransferase involved in cell wall biosynthesis